MTQLARFRGRLCTFNDDIQGTAATVLGGLYVALRTSGEAIWEQRMLIAGAGASAQGIADLFVCALRDEGLPIEDARRRIATVDSRGLVTVDRPGLEPFKATYALPAAEVADYVCGNPRRVTLEEAVRNFRPTILVGTSGAPGAFTEGVVRSMAAIHARPIVFPLSNPTSKSECTAEQAVRWSDGRAIVATGSPFPPVAFGGRLHRIGQGNNAFIFPGVGLGLWVGRVRRVTYGMFIDAARALASQVTLADAADGAVYPELTRIRQCSHAVACAVVRRAMADGQSALPPGTVVEDAVSSAMWFPEYHEIRYEPRVELAAVR